MTKHRRDILVGLGLLLVAGTAGAYFMFQNPRSSGQRTEFAADREQSTTPGLVAFSGQQAMGYIQQICNLGPRISGTPQHAKMVDMLEKHFTDLGASVERQKFEGKQLSKLHAVPMVNLIVRWNPEKKNRLIVCTHYDTRPLADQEPNPRDWTKPFVGANDGGSGVAWMMEMGKYIKGLETPLGIDFVCFDGEEYIFNNNLNDPGRDIYFLGSSHFAQEYDKKRKAGDQMVYKEGVLLDMIAGRNPRFTYEGHSIVQAGAVVERIWKIAEQEKCRAFVRQYGQNVLDDHLELLKVGIPTIDIIPAMPDRDSNPMLSYLHWHRLSDVPANCAPEGMEQVAKVLAVWMKTTK